MDKTKFIMCGDVHVPVAKLQRDMLSELHRASVIYLLNRFGLRAERNYILIGDRFE